MNERDTRFHTFVPLTNFDSEVEQIFLDSRTSLIHMKDELKSSLIAGLSFRGKTLLAKAKCVIDFKGAIYDVRLIELVVLTLRLFQPGRVGFPCLSLSSDGKQWAVDEAFYNAELELAYSSDNPCFLRKEQVEDFKKLFEKLHDAMTEKPHLDFSLAHFTRGLEDRNIEDRLVYYATALESLIFQAEPKTIEPAGKVIGIALGMLLGQNERERMDIEKTVIEAYEIRNAKVHGNVEKLAKHRKDAERIVEEAEELLRRTLKKFVEE